MMKCQRLLTGSLMTGFFLVATGASPQTHAAKITSLPKEHRQHIDLSNQRAGEASRFPYVTPSQQALPNTTVPEEARNGFNESNVTPGTAGNTFDTGGKPIQIFNHSK